MLQYSAQVTYKTVKVGLIWFPSAAVQLVPVLLSLPSKPQA